MKNLHGSSPPILREPLLRLFFVVILLLLPVHAHAAESDTITITSPTGDLWLTRGDDLNVTVKGPAGAQARFTLEPGAESIPLYEEQPGFYTGILRICRLTDSTTDCDLHVTLYHSGASTTIKSPARIKILGSAVPRIALGTEAAAVIRSGPGSDYDRVALLPESARVEVSGKQCDWYRIKLRENHYWIHESAIRLLPPGAQAGEPLLRLISLKPQERDSLIQFDLSQRCPFSLNDSMSPPSLDLTLYNATSSLFETAYRSHDDLVDSIEYTENSPAMVRCRVHLKNAALWGYEGNFNGNSFVLKIKSAPVMAGRKNLAGLRVILDPGHGGKDPGAVGAGMLNEKEANFAICLQLKQMLEHSGAEVILTRDDDMELTSEKSPASEELKARVDKGREKNGTIFISVHNNALADVSRGRVARGTYTYFYRLQSLELAKAINESLAGSLGEEKNAHILRSFHVIRQTSMPAVLVEVTFISNPGEELKLRDCGYRAKAAQAIHDGVVEFTKRQGKRSIHEGMK